ncbi:hypothetical protein [Burkholderia pyrrocinia]|uniref:hypothetical protein n=1 Tax=Burkholderia pyrrocinia TaxID=60550 RepID=UPI001FC8C04B|nr:hypothetical protein [Burkholderia pyrrocinia]
MHADPVEYKTSTIMPLASISMPGYAATALLTHRSGKREALGILGYFASEQAACQFAVEYAKAHIDGRRRPKPPFSLRWLMAQCDTDAIGKITALATARVFAACSVRLRTTSSERSE